MYMEVEMLFNITIRFVREIDIKDVDDRNYSEVIISRFRRDSMNESQLQSELVVVIDQLVEKPDSYSITDRNKELLSRILFDGKNLDGKILGYFLLNYISRSFDSSVNALKWAQGIMENVKLNKFEVFFDIQEINSESIGSVEKLIKKEIESEVREKFEEAIKQRVEEEERKKLSQKIEPEIRDVLQSTLKSEIETKRAEGLRILDREKSKIQEEIQNLKQNLNQELDAERKKQIDGIMQERTSIQEEIQNLKQNLNQELDAERKKQIDGIMQERTSIQEEIQNLSKKLEEQKSCEHSLSRVECDTASRVKISGSENDLRLYALAIFTPKKLSEERALEVCQNIELLLGGETAIASKDKHALRRSKITSLCKFGKLNIQFHYWSELDGIPFELKDYFSKALADAKSVIKQIDTLIYAYDE